MQLYRHICGVCIGLFLISVVTGCAKPDGRRPAPVVHLGSSYSASSTASIKSNTKNTKSIALDAPLKLGQVSETSAASALSKQPTTVVGRGAPDSKWLWPAKGEVIGGFGTGQKLNKGLDIAARPGEPVHATAEGQVVYSGRGLKGYGDLIILKHDSQFLSAYAHNQKLLVKEGDSVRSGQVIALAGDTDAHRVMLHFEIRKAGKPVDPLDYLPAQR
jgi:murein DD-endopeptidase MepM/ murein hydrolase activator NlpD